MAPLPPVAASAPSTGAGERMAIRGDLLDFVAEPDWSATESAAVRFRADHWLLVDRGRIVAAQVDAPGDGWVRHDHAGALVLPGFVDSHVHSGQIDVIASYGTALLDWLTTHTFPAEARHRERGHAEAAAAHFVDALLAHGTTTAVIFPTVHAQSVEALFTAAEARGMRLVAGKVLMDRNAPPDLVDDVAGAERDMEDLIARWHNRGRCA
ncbi:MAG: amidohydrolase family protein, partial [Rhizobacter sp.]|nr:amidohydrolase family protein [Rhizobacter sp.]